MNALDHLATKLDQHPHIHYERTSESISVEPGDESGFRGEFRVKDVRFTVSFDGWHEEFTSEDEALGCFRLGLSPDCRLAVTYRGPIATKWVLEYREGDAWVSDSVTGLLVPPFWRKRIVYKQNHFLAAV